MNKFIFILCFSLLFNCAQPKEEKTTQESNVLANDTVEVASTIGPIAQPQTYEPLVLKENGLNNIALPFKRKDMLSTLSKLFADFQVTKEMGQQDGPDFPLYSVKDQETELVFFGMDWEDTLKLDRIYIKVPLIIDEYGLKVGDNYQDIKALRQDSIKTFTDYHQHTYVYSDSSNIFYEIWGQATIPDTADFENLHFTEEQIKDWKIEYVIWRD